MRLGDARVFGRNTPSGLADLRAAGEFLFSFSSSPVELVTLYSSFSDSAAQALHL
jgi:hypothetical protein